MLGQAFVDIFTQALDSAAEAVPGPMGDILSAVSDGVDEIGERFKGLREIWSAGDNPLESLHLAMVYGLTLLDGDLSTLQENITSSLPASPSSPTWAARSCPGSPRESRWGCRSSPRRRPRS